MLAPARRRPGKPYRVLYSLLYARFAWVERASDGSICVDSARYAKQLGLRTHALREALAHLREMGALDQLIWHKTWFKARPACPPGLARVVGARQSAPDAPGPVPETIDV